MPSNEYEPRANMQSMIDGDLKAFLLEFRTQGKGRPGTEYKSEEVVDYLIDKILKKVGSLDFPDLCGSITYLWDKGDGYETIPNCIKRKNKQAQELKQKVLERINNYSSDEHNKNIELTSQIPGDETKSAVVRYLDSLERLAVGVGAYEGITAMRQSLGDNGSMDNNPYYRQNPQARFDAIILCVRRELGINEPERQAEQAPQREAVRQLRGNAPISRSRLKNFLDTILRKK